MKKIAAIICSHTNSQRVANKPFKLINGKPLLGHLLDRLDVDVILAVNHKEPYKKFNKKIFEGLPEDPLARMYHASVMHKVDTIIRICHDKMFVDPHLLQLAIDFFNKKKLDYLFSSKFTPGSGFEIISSSALAAAAGRFKDVEHISYSIRNVTKNVHDFDVPKEYRSAHRLLVDYPEDINLLEVVLSQLGNDCSLKDVISYLNENPYVSQLNKLPKFTFYTCVKDGEKFIQHTIDSVIDQTVFRDSEYLIVDDFSSDKTPEIVAAYASTYKNIKFIRNSRNIGLSASSNVALENSKGQLIVRIDADDYFSYSSSVDEMSKALFEQNVDVVYPDNYYGAIGNIQSGDENHHVGGALFKTSSVNYIKFSGILRGYEGLDFFHRAKSQLRIGYYKKPAFFYRQHPDSLSKNNLAQRQEIFKKITGEYSESKEVARS